MGIRQARVAGTGPDRRRNLWTRTSAIVLLLVFCMGTVAGMAWLVLREIDELSTANSDNLQWSLAQAGVEFLQFELAVNKAHSQSGPLGDVRRRYDVFYSRMHTLERGAVFRSLRREPEFAGPHQEISTFLTALLPLIDGDDAALAAALPEIAATARLVYANVRQISFSGLAAFATLSDQRREQLVLTLFRLSLVLAGLLCGLSLLAFSFRHLYRAAAQHARAAQRAGTRIRTVVEAAVDAIIVSGDDGRIADMNEAARRLFGYARAEALGRRAVDLCHPEQVRDELLSGPLNAFRNGKRPLPHERLFETVAVDRNRREFPVEISMDMAEDAGERVYVAHIRDISGRKAAEKDLTVARDRALAGEKTKAEFLALMSHEMRTPLNGLLGTMELLRDHTLTRRQSDLLDHMQSSGRLLLGLVNDVLDLSKFEAGKLQAEQRPFSMTQLLDGVVETTMSLAAANENTVAWACCGPAEAQVLGDARRLRQVLLNLVSNAIKFTRGGTIDIEVERLPGPGDLVEFRVIDTGIGIAPEHLERIFKDFETLDSSYARQAGGTGLGLGISKRFVGLMGGEIGVESRLGAGSRFWLRLPLPEQHQQDVPAATAPAPAPTLAPASTARPLSILLVEDNEINRFVARAMIEAEGHRLTEAVNGQAGVAQAQEQAFDVILMDISMPVMDGQEATRRIRAGKGASADVPIVAVTAHALPEEITRFCEAGMTRCLSKPIDRRTLIDLLNELAGGPAPAAPEPKVEAPGLLDTVLLNELANTLGAAEFDQLVEMCLAELDSEIAALAASAPADPDLGCAAHKCAGSCGSFGLAALRTALGEIEAQAARGPVAPDQLQALTQMWQASRAALSDWAAARQYPDQSARQA